MNEANTDKTDSGYAAPPGPCPSDDILGLFAERRLSGPQMAEVAEHIAACAKCKSGIADLAEWLAAGKDLDTDAATDVERRAVEKALDAVRMQRARELWEKVFAAIKPAREYLAAREIPFHRLVVKLLEVGGRHAGYMAVRRLDDGKRLVQADFHPHPPQIHLLEHGFGKFSVVGRILFGCRRNGSKRSERRSQRTGRAKSQDISASSRSFKRFHCRSTLLEL